MTGAPRLAVLLTCALAAQAAVGCAPAGDVRLIEVTAAGPRRIEPNATLRLSGAGFPEGRACEVRMRGEVARPGQGRAPVRAVTTGRAVSTERVEVSADARLLEAVGGGGTFHGGIEVAFEARAPDARLVGTLDGATLHFVPSAAARVRAARARAPEAEALAAFLGVVRDATPSGAADGVRLAEVAAGSRGAAAGLLAGDVVLEADGAVVDAPSDLVAAPGATQTVWRVARAGEAAPVTVVVPLGGLGGAPERSWQAATAIVTAAVALALLLLSPLGAPWHRLGRRAARAAAAPARAEDAGLATAAAVAALAASLAAWRLPAVDVMVLGLAATALAALVARHAWRAVLARQALGWLALGPPLLADGTAALGALAELRGLEPAAWGALRGPAAALSAAVWATAVLGGPMRAAPAGGPLGRGTRVARRAHHVLWVVVGVGVFGPGVAATPGAGWSARVAAAAGAALTAFGTSYAASRLGRAAGDVGGRPRAALGIGAVASVVAWAVTASLGLDPAASALAGQATRVAAMVSAVVVLIAAWAASRDGLSAVGRGGRPTARAPAGAPQPAGHG